MNGCRATANPVSMGCGSQENECGLRGHHTLPSDCACCLLKPPVGRRPVSLRLVPYSANEKNVVQSPTAVHAAGQHACFLSRGHGACCHSRRPSDEQGRDDRQRPGGKYKAPFFCPCHQSSAM